MTNIPNNFQVDAIFLQNTKRFWNNMTCFLKELFGQLIIKTFYKISFGKLNKSRIRKFLSCESFT